MKVNWILYGRVWHAWARGDEQTLCHKVTSEKLQRKPAKAISEEAPTKSQCSFCRRILLPTTRAWMVIINRHLERVRGRLAIDTHVAIAERLATIGPPAEQRAINAYSYVRDLLLTPQVRSNKHGKPYHTFTGIADALKLLPLEDPSKLQHVIASADLWQRITGRALSRDKRFQRPRAIETMLEIPFTDMGAYIRYLRDAGLTNFAAVFHPNTLERVKHSGSMRAAFDKDNADYWEETKEQLNVIS